PGFRRMGDSPDSSLHGSCRIGSRDDSVWTLTAPAGALRPGSSRRCHPVQLVQFFRLQMFGIFQLISATRDGVNSVVLTATAPFINQTPILPVAWFCHTKSGWLSPLKSPVRTIFQFVSVTWLGLNKVVIFGVAPC